MAMPPERYVTMVTGLVQLEALEMLSTLSEGRVLGLLATLKGAQLDTIKVDLITMKDIFELKDKDEDEGRLSARL